MTTLEGVNKRDGVLVGVWKGLRDLEARGPVWVGVRGSTAEGTLFFGVAGSGAIPPFVQFSLRLSFDDDGDRDL